MFVDALTAATRHEYKKAHALAELVRERSAARAVGPFACRRASQAAPVIRVNEGVRNRAFPRFGERHTDLHFGCRWKAPSAAFTALTSACTAHQFQERFLRYRMGSASICSYRRSTARAVAPSNSVAARVTASFILA